MPRDIVSLGARVASDCEDCRKWRPRMHKLTLKTRLASTFNEYVLQDLFFLFNETFILMVDECIRWKQVTT